MASKKEGFGEFNWQFPGRILSIVDGDTLDCELDLGFHQRGTYRLRLLCYCDEIRGHKATERGQQAKRFVQDWARSATELGIAAEASWPVLVETRKSDVFGRWLAYVTRLDGRELTADLVAAGLATREKPGKE